MSVVLKSAPALLLAILVASPALAQEPEPYSGGGVTATTIAPSIGVAASGLTANFTAVGAGGQCTWDFGDGSTGSGNPVVHTFAGAGTYGVSVNCGGLATTRVVTIAALLALTGFEAGRWMIAGLVLVAGGMLVVFRARRIRAN